MKDQLIVPKSASQIFTICKYDLLKSLRGKKILAVLAIAISVPSLLLFIPELTGTEFPNTSRDFFSSNLVFIHYVLVFSAVLLGSNALVSEFQEKTGYTLFTNPVSRESIWLGKFFSVELLALTVTSIFYVIIGIGGFFVYENIPEEIFSSWILSLIVGTMFVSVAFLISSFARGPTGAAVLILLLFIFVFPTMDQVLINLAETKPWYSPTFAAKIIDFVIFDPYPIDVEPGDLPRGPFDHHRFVPYVDQSLTILFSIIFLTSLGSVMNFKRRQMN